MVFIGEEQHLGWNATQTCCVKCTHTLVGIDAIVFLAVNNQDGSVPLINKLVRTIGIGLLCRFCGISIPIGIVILPVGEPNLFCVGVHAFEVECAVVGNECFEPFVVMPGEIINRETTKAGSNAT